MRTASLAIVFLALTAFQDASRWHQVAGSEQGDVWYLDMQRSQVEGNIVRAWFRVDRSSNRTSEFSEAIMQREIDCSSLTVRRGSAVFRRRNGTSVSEGRAIQSYTPWDDITPDSVLEGAANRTCALFGLRR
jgi:hypothetical protein